MYVFRPGIEPRTPDLRVRCPTDCATRPGFCNGTCSFFVETYTVTFKKNCLSEAVLLSDHNVHFYGDLRT